MGTIQKPATLASIPTPQGTLVLEASTVDLTLVCDHIGAEGEFVFVIAPPRARVLAALLLCAAEIMEKTLDKEPTPR